MTPEILLVFSTGLLGFALVSGPAQRSPVSAPMIFLALGVLSRELLPIGDSAGEVLSSLAELTLVVVLFTDAARMRLKALWQGRGLPARLLIVGLPGTILLGGLAAGFVFPGLALAEAVLLGSILAPTDAALGQAVVSNKSVPLNVRQALNAESGLNDGIAFPVVLAAAAMALSGPMGTAGISSWIGFAGKQILFGALVGFIVSTVGGRLLRRAEQADRVSPSFDRIALLAVAGASFAGAELVGGNGFIAAFVGGLTLANTAPGVCECMYEFGEAEGQLFSLIVFALFGAVLVPEYASTWSGPVILYAVLSLTVIRAIPVAISLIGTRTDAPTVAFLGWFGPRGLASILFLVLVVEKTNLPNGELIAGVVTLVVLLSTVLHGATAYPLAQLYAKTRSGEAEAGFHILPVRIRHSGPPDSLEG